MDADPWNWEGGCIGDFGGEREGRDGGGERTGRLGEDTVCDLLLLGGEFESLSFSFSK